MHRIKEKIVLLKPYIKYLVLYTLAFCLICSFAFLPFIENQKLLVWKVDGMPQYVEWFRYTGHYLRNIIKNALHGNFHLQMYDFSIGFGGDVRSFLKMDPFMFLGALVPKQGWLCQAFSLLVLFRIYLMGISFSIYVLYIEVCKTGSKATEVLENKTGKRLAMLMATLIYTFSNYTYFQVVRHPQFAMAAIMLPMLLIGLEQVIKKENFLFYSFMVAISLMTSYYFLYINTFIMGLYALLRLFDHYKTHRVKEFFAMLGRIIVSYLLGCGMSAVFFAPSIASYFLSSRSGAVGAEDNILGSLLTYSRYRIPKVILGSFSPVNTSSYLTTTSVSAIMIPVVVLLFSGKWKENRTVKLGLIIGYICLLLPIFGYIMSGFSTINNRFSYGVVFAFAMAMLCKMNQIKDITKKQLAVCIGFAVFAACLLYAFQMKQKGFLEGIIILFAIIAILILMKLVHVKNPRVWNLVIVGMVCITTAFTGYFLFSENGVNLVNEFQDYETGNAWFTRSRFHYFADMPEEGFYRDDTNMMFNNYNNVSVTMDYNGISLYNSTIGSSTVEYFVESESTGISAVNRTLSLDNRTAQEALACVKYYLTDKKDGTANVPYGFEKDSSLLPDSKVYDMYVNQDLLSVGYSYDTVISESEYEALPAVEKQQVMLQRAVISDEDMKDFTDLKESGADSGDVTQGKVEITGVDKGIVQKGKTFKVKKKMKVESYKDENGVDRSKDLSPKVHFTTKSKKNSEVYLRLKDMNVHCNLRADVNVYIDGVKKRAIYRTQADVYNLGMDDFIVNLGYFEDEEDIEGEISFSTKGKYTIDDFEVYYVSMDNYEKEIAALSDQDLENEKVEDGHVSGVANTEDDKLMTFSIPYNVGWKAYVDGKEVKIYKVNTMYMGVRLEKGKHKVELKYASPGIKIGAIISAVSCLIFLILLVLWFRKRKKMRIAK